MNAGTYFVFPYIFLPDTPLFACTYSFAVLIDSNLLPAFATPTGFPSSDFHLVGRLVDVKRIGSYLTFFSIRLPWSYPRKRIILPYRDTLV